MAFAGILFSQTKKIREKVPASKPKRNASQTNVRDQLYTKQLNILRPHFKLPLNIRPKIARLKPMENTNISLHETLRHAEDLLVPIGCASQPLSNAVKNFTPALPITPKFSPQSRTA